MPVTPFDSLPADARVWVFASSRPLDLADAAQLLSAVDGYLADWKAHGEPLRCARDWADQRFLAIGVDPTVEQASGCSIDGLFRRLRELETRLGAQLVGGGRVFYRDADGVIHAVGRAEFSKRAARGDVNAATTVFDTAITSAHDWHERFARPAGEAWTAELLPVT